MKEINYNGHTIRVVEMGEEDPYLTDSDKEMDARAQEAVRVAIEKARFCKKPIARYDEETQKAYLEYPDGSRDYGE